jgi:hypothetical protein
MVGKTRLVAGFFLLHEPMTIFYFPGPVSENISENLWQFSPNKNLTI